MIRYKLLTKNDFPEIIVDEESKESFKKALGWNEIEFKKRTRRIIPYYIYVCKYCESQITESIMGGRCPDCGEWTYYKDCKKECDVKQKKQKGGIK